MSGERLYEDQINRALGVFEHKNNVRDHYYCVKEIFDIYNDADKLEKLTTRPDLDTVCAFDYVRMKKFALQGHGLQYKDYHPEVQGISVPTLTREQ